VPRNLGELGSPHSFGSEAVTVCVSVAPRGAGDRPLARLEESWLAPALQALRGRLVDAVSLHVAGRYLQVRRPVGWRLWRRNRPWWDVLAS
jgi:hypothetical protein